MNRLSTLISTAASAVALVFGLTALHLGTDNWQAWTAESARRLDVEKKPLSLGPLVLKTEESADDALWGYAEQPQLVLMEFIFTSCPTVCQLMGAEFAALQSRLFDLEKESGNGKSIEEKLDVRLLSVSFDPKDDLQAMRQYGERYGASDQWWTLALPENLEQLARTQKQLGSIVIPEPALGFIHNSAVYAIYKGSVVAILDHDDRAGIDNIIDRYAYQTRSPKGGNS